MAALELERRKWYTLKCALYVVANNLTSHDVDHIKFLLADCFPRQELEKARSGFCLFCLLCTRRELLSPNNYSFLEEILSEVGKSGCLEEIFSDMSSSFYPPSIVHDTNFEAISLQLKEFLDSLADKLTRDDIQTLSLFFADVCESISYASAVALMSAKDMFIKLQEGQVIGVGHLQPLHKPLVLIGRLDLATSVEQFSSGMWPSSHYPEPS